MAEIYHNPVYAYLAGFIDGDGSITVRRYNCGRGKKPSYRLSITASQLEEHREPLDLLHDIFGGTIRKLSTKYRGSRRVLQWELHGRKAGDMLGCIFPYLLVKHKVSVLATFFHLYKQSQRANRLGRGKVQSDEEVSVGVSVSKACSFFNGRGRDPSIALSNQIN